MMASDPYSSSKRPQNAQSKTGSSLDFDLKTPKSMNITIIALEVNEAPAFEEFEGRRSFFLAYGIFQKTKKYNIAISTFRSCHLTLK